MEGKDKPRTGLAMKRRAAQGKDRASYSAKRDKIVKASGPVLKQYGLNGTTIEAIAREAGVDRATIYYYFADKEDVNQSTVEIVGIGTERSNPDYYALSVMNEIFSGGFGSRVVQYVRTKLGLAYEVGGGIAFAYDHPAGHSPHHGSRTPCSTRPFGAFTMSRRGEVI